MENKVSCASRIREALKARDMTQADLCKLTGIPKSAMSQYCNDGLRPRQNRIFSMAQALRVNPAWLMGLDVQMETNAPATSGERKELIDLIPNLSDEIVHALLALAKQAGPQK